MSYSNSQRAYYPLTFMMLLNHIFHIWYFYYCFFVVNDLCLFPLNLFLLDIYYDFILQDILESCFEIFSVSLNFFISINMIVWPSWLWSKPLTEKLKSREDGTLWNSTSHAPESWFWPINECNPAQQMFFAYSPYYSSSPPAEIVLRGLVNVTRQASLADSTIVPVSRMHSHI